MRTIREGAAAAIAGAIAIAGCMAGSGGPMAAKEPAPVAVDSDQAAFAAAIDMPSAIAELPSGQPAPIDAAALNGRKTGDWAAAREFAIASYDPADTGPRDDFRETILWAPSVKTGADGRATVEFPTSDAITGFRVTAEGIAGGAPGHGEVAFASRLPVSIAANLPVEVTTGDRVALPVTITNNTGTGVDAVVRAQTGAALVVAGVPARALHLPAHGVRTVTIKLDVRGADGANGAGDIELAVEAGAASDRLKRSLAIVPNGFPNETNVAGTLDGRVRHTITLPATAVAGSVHTTARVYPTPIATMQVAADAMIREPGGCFEQASSENYPNVLVLRYLGATGADTSGVAERATAALQHGYQLLTSYQTTDHGYDWFGEDPGHEALTAYGVLEFREMAKVFPDVDTAMVSNAIKFLRSRRDGKGGYKRNDRSHQFGAASPEVTDAYITYALAESGEQDLETELARSRATSKTATDPYLLSLAAAAVLAADASDADGKAALARLAKLQADDGRFAGADHSITRSYGQALDIETTALAALAMMKSAAAYRGEIERALAWITTQRDQYGGFSSTQATILALEALTRQATARPFPANTTITIAINGADVASTTLDTDGGAIELPDLGPHLAPGDNLIELRATAGATVEYSLGARWYDATPATSPAATVAVTATLDRRRVRAGRPVRLTAVVENVTATGQPMTIARIGIPGGVKYQPWQLDELVAKHVVDFVETREREVTLYFRDLAPNARRKVTLELLAQVPGTYVGPPSSAYLYYTDENRQYDRPLAIEVQRPPVHRKKKPVVAAPASGAVTGGVP